jgi:hypothetical protein
MNHISSTIRTLTREVALIGITAGVILAAIGLLNRGPKKVEEQPSLSGPLVAVGSSVDMSNNTLRDQQHSLVLVSSPNCHFCISSEQFHDRLAREATQHGVQFIVAVPDPVTAKPYTAKLHLASDHIMAWKDLRSSVQGTPTLMLLGPKGMVQRLWIGQLSQYEENQALSVVDPKYANSAVPGLAATRPEGDMSLDQAQNLLQKRAVDIIDIRERSASVARPIAHAISMPLQELSYRAQYELDPKLLHLVDCSNVQVSTCEVGVQALKKQGLIVGTIDKGAFQGAICKATKTL